MENKLSIQETLNEAKKELTNDEHMLASAFKAERLYKKHKLKIYSLLTIATIYVLGTVVTDSLHQHRLESANSAYLALTKDENNTKALEELKSSNPALFDLYSYQKAIKNSDTKELKVLSSNQNPIISDISSYHLAVLEKRTAQSELYDGFAHVNNSKLLIKQGKIDDARDELDSISEDSPVYNIAKIIKHYTIKGK